jgi:integrase
MHYSATITKRKRRKKTEYIARLQYYDKDTGARRENTRSTSSSAEAKRALKNLEAEYLSGGSDLLDAHHMTFDTLAEHSKTTQYCEAVYDERGRKLFGVRHPKKVGSLISRLVSVFGHLKLHEITVAHLTNYRQTRLTTKTNKGTCTDVATVNRELSTMRAMLNDAIANDWLVRSPFTRAKRGELIPVAHETQRTTVLSAADEKKLLAQCETPKRRHLKALIIAALDSGCRRGELLRLTWADVDFKSNSFQVMSYKGKTVKTRVVPITTRLRAALLDLRAKPSSSAFRRLKSGELPDQTLVFGIVTNIKTSFEGARVDAGLPGLHFHDLRHVTGTRLSAGGMSTALVGEILGHSDPKTTYRYINRTSDTVSAAAAILNKRQHVSITDHKKLRGK